MEYLITEMCSQHIKGIAETERFCFSHPRSEKSLESELQNDNSLFLAAVTEDNKVAGYGGMDIVLDEAYIVNIAVHPDYRKKGIGNAILKKLIDYCENQNFSFITLEVRKSNTVAYNLYKKHGFETVGERKNFYRDPKEDALIMTKYFNSQI